jgi:hypothetical protein
LKEYFFDTKSGYNYRLKEVSNRLRTEYPWFCDAYVNQWGQGQPYAKITVYDYKNSDNAFNIIFEKVMKECNLFE